MTEKNQNNSSSNNGPKKKTQEKKKQDLGKALRDNLKRRKIKKK